jgi:hypothetical protein
MIGWKLEEKERRRPINTNELCGKWRLLFLQAAAFYFQVCAGNRFGLVDLTGGYPQWSTILLTEELGKRRKILSWNEAQFRLHAGCKIG